jgi:mono/diheme cytochrome c family protein
LELLATTIANSASETQIDKLKKTAQHFKDPENVWVKNAIVNGIGNSSTKESEIATIVPTNVDQKIYAAGRQKYINICASCHGTNGEGMKRFAPPLKKSEWVTGDDQKLAMLLLHGMQGAVEVNGKMYDTPDILPEMPSFSTLQNQDIAAIATYIRNAWGNSGDEVTSSTVGSVRFRTQGKVTPWTSKELDTLVFDIDM